MKTLKPLDLSATEARARLVKKLKESGDPGHPEALEKLNIMINDQYRDGIFAHPDRDNKRIVGNNSELKRYRFDGVADGLERSPSSAAIA